MTQTDAAGRSRRRILGAVAVSLLGLAVAGILVADGSTNDTDEPSAPGSAATAEEDREAVADAAADFGVALFTYDHAETASLLDRVAELSTDAYATEFAGAYEAGLGSVIEEVAASSTAVVREVFLGEVGRERATAIVVVDAEVSSDLGTRDLSGAHLRLELLRIDGAWRVNEVVPLSAEDESLIPTPTGAPSEPS